MDLGLNNKVAFVAASSQGLGRAVAESLAAEGASLILCSRTAAVLQKTAADIAQTTGADVLAKAADITDPATVEALFRAGEERFGRIDILVTNTGGPPSGPFESHDREMWQRAAQQNLLSVIELTRLALPGMKARRWGRIINITSISAKQPVDDLILSNTMRAAVTGFARTLANETAPYGVTVNNVLPGYTRTARVENLAKQLAASRGVTAEDIIENIAASIPMGRMAQPAEFASAVTFLASERASYITGTSLAVDGGWIRALS